MAAEIPRSDTETELQTSLPSPRPVPSRRAPYLHVLTGASAGTLFPMPGAAVSIGRGEGADVRLPDASISRRHATLEIAEDGSVLLTDQGSRNGTWVGSERVTTSTLRQGALFNVGGGTVIQVGWYDEEEVTLLSRLYSASVRDGATGLLNREHFLERGRAVMLRCMRQQASLAVALVAPVEPATTDVLRELAAKLAESHAMVARWDEQRLVALFEGSRQALEDALRHLPVATRSGAALINDRTRTLEEAVEAAEGAQGEQAVSWAQGTLEEPVRAHVLTCRREEAVLEVRCFGPLAASRSSGPIPESDFKTQRVRWLLGHLLVMRGRGVMEDELVDCYWPDAGPAGCKSLNTALSTLRKALGNEGGQPILRERGFVRVNPECPLWDDVDALGSCLAEAAAHRREGRVEARVASLEEAAALYRGPFLEGCYHDWALERRDHYQRLVVDILQELAVTSLDAGDARRGLEHGLRAVALDPFHQDAQLQVMRAHRLLGRPDRAIKHFERYAQALRRELELEPAIAVVEECLRARLGLTDDRPSL